MASNTNATTVRNLSNRKPANRVDTPVMWVIASVSHHPATPAEGATPARKERLRMFGALFPCTAEGKLTQSFPSVENVAITQWPDTEPTSVTGLLGAALAPLAITGKRPEIAILLPKGAKVSAAGDLDLPNEAAVDGVTQMAIVPAPTGVYFRPSAAPMPAEDPVRKALEAMQAK